VAFLSTETLGFCDSYALKADVLEGFLHIVELEGLDDGHHNFHGVLIPRFAVIDRPVAT